MAYLAERYAFGPNFIPAAKVGLKKFMAIRTQLPDEAVEYDQITLHPLNTKGHLPIHLTNDGDYAICGWFVGSVKRLTRDKIKHYEYPLC